MNDVDQPTRRRLLKGVAVALGVSVLGTAGGHPGAGDHGEDHFHPPEDQAGTTEVLYDGLGGSDAHYHYGGISELKVAGDFAYVGVLSSKDPTYDRGLAVVDVSKYTQAPTKAALEDAVPEVDAFVPNENNAVSVMDVKLSSDRHYAFLSKQPVAVLFEDEEVRTDPENLGNSPESGSLQAVDVSDPSNPEIVGRWDGWGLGPHNSDHLRIGGQDYVFAVKGPTGEPAGIYVVEFDRDSGEMHLVNYWLDGANFGAGELEDLSKGTPAHDNDYYAHDIAVERDPKTGEPIAYLANWNQGGRVLDVSDPREIRELGRFQQQRAHEIWPVTVTGAGGEPKRLYVTGQENPDSHYGTAEGETGYVYVIDADPVDAVLAGNDEGPVDLGQASNRQGEDGDRPTELAKWILSTDVEFDNYTLSAHNLEPFEVEIDGAPRQFVAVGHYHAGIRILELSEALGHDGPNKYLDCGLREVEDTLPLDPTEEGFGQVAYFRSHEKDVPTEAKMAGLTEATPDFWCAVQSNGVVFGSGINTGLYAVTVDPDRGRDNRPPRHPDHDHEHDFHCKAPTAPDIPVGTDRPIDVEVDRDMGPSVQTAGQSARVTLTVDADEPVLLRDRVPHEWDVLEEHSPAVEPVDEVGDGQLVYLGEVAPGADVTYFADVGDESGGRTVGEVQYSTDGREWNSVAGTVAPGGVVGVSTVL